MAPPRMNSSEEFLARSLLELYKRWVADGRPKGKTPEAGLVSKTSDAENKERIAAR